MDFSVKNLLKWLGFFILAVVVFVGFVYPFSLVPKLYEDRAYELTRARVANGSMAVDEKYIDESVRDAVSGNIDSIFTAAFWIAAAVALVVFCLSIRPPHDCGGLNWFNPIGLIFTFTASVLTALVVGLIIKNSSAKSAGDLMVLVRNLTNGFTFSENKLFCMLIVPVVLEVVFRGIIFSYLEKIHFSVAILLSTAAYAVAVYLIVGSYANWSGSGSDAAICAFFAALVIGFVNSVITWRLRSGIPAVLSHILIAYFSSWANGVVYEGSVTLFPMALLLALTLAGMVFVHTFLAKKYPVFAPDFPLTKHHERMYEWLYDARKKLPGKKSQKTGGDPSRKASA